MSTQFGGGTRFAGEDQGGHIIQDEGVDLPQQPKLNFIGPGVVATDVLGVTNVTIAGAVGAAHTIQDEGSDLTPRTNLNFVGAGVTATDGGAGPDSTIVTIPGAAATGYQTIEEEGTPVAQETVMNFIGAGVTAVAGTGKTDITIPGGITQAYQTIEDEGTPLAQETVLNFVGAGVVASAGAGETVVTIAGGINQAYQTVEDEGTPLAQETVLNFVGAGVTATAGAGETIVTIPGAVGPSGHVIQDEGTPLTDRANLNFVGAGVTVTDGGVGPDSTIVTIPFSATSNDTLQNKNINDANNVITNLVWNTAMQDETAGDLPFWNVATNPVRLPIGSVGQVLTVVGGIPAWADPAAGQAQSFVIAASDETTDLITGDAALTFRMPYGFTLTAVRASVNDAPTGTVITVNIREAGVDILSNPITIDANELTSVTAASPPVISDANLADDAEMKIDIDTVGSTNAGKGLKVVLIGNPV